MSAGRTGKRLPMESYRSWRTMKVYCAFVSAMLLLLVFSLAVASEPAIPVRERITFMPAGVSILAERAASTEKRERGLMYRTRLAEKDAMMFYFDETAYHSFWMY